MYRQDYADIAVDDQRDARRREFDAIDRVVASLERAAKSGGRGAELTEALDLLDLLWTLFLQDLSNDENGLPEELRARLISIGLWMFQQSAALRIAGGGDLSSIIDINVMIRDGMR